MTTPLTFPDQSIDAFDRRNLLKGAAALAATAVTMKAASRRPSRHSAKPALRPDQPSRCPWDRCPAAAIRTLIWSSPRTQAFVRAHRFSGLRRHHGGRARRDRLPLGRGPGLLPGRPVPAVQRHSQQPHHALLEDDGHLERVPPAVDELERQHHRSRRTPDHLRAQRPAGHPDRTRRLDHHHRRQVQRQAAELAERRGRRFRRLDLVHRSRSTASAAIYEGIKAEPEQEKHNVYRVDPKSGDIKVVVDDFVEPNGIAFSPDEKKLYVIDTGFTDGPDNPSHIRVFDVDVGGRKGVERQSLCGNAQAQHHRRHALSTPTGNVWCSVGWGDPNEDGVRCYTPDGDLLGKIHMPETVANLCFGGQQRNRLYICGSTSLYAVYTSVQGAHEAVTDQPTSLLSMASRAASPESSRRRFATRIPLYPLFRSPAEMPLMVSWMPRSTCSSGFCARCSFNSSTCTWLSGSR